MKPIMIEFDGQQRDFRKAYCWVIRTCGQGASAEVWFDLECSAIEEFTSLEAAHERRREICKEILKRKEPMINTNADKLDEIRKIAHEQRDDCIPDKPVSFWGRFCDWWNRVMVCKRFPEEAGSLPASGSDLEEL